jgi:hypothetical protein
MKYGFPLLVDSFPRLFLGLLKFETVENGQAISGTRYIYEFQEAEISAWKGRRVEQTQIYLRDTANNIRFPKRLGFFGMAFDNGVCIDCVSTIKAGAKTYLVISPNGRFSGGSAGYVLKVVYEIVGNQAVRREGFLSCGRVYRRGNQLIFPSRVDECPESIVGYLPWNNWEYETFDLTD